jgi:ribosomal protein L3 glutamine methyltransferase
MPSPCPPELLTPRDFLRYAVSRFTEAKLAFGHGATSAFEEAAFIVLEGLHLPVDQLDPFLDARLTQPERQRLADLIEARVTTRKPAAYLLNKAYIGPMSFFVDERVIVPRSYLGELMLNGLFEGGDLPWDRDPASVETILDLCTGSGCLALVAAHLFPNARVDGVDLSDKALEVAAINLKEHGLADRVRFLRGDLFAPLKRKKYDLIITNPPYVKAADVKAFPPEFAAEPPMAHLGGADGLDLVRRILADAPRHLTKGGGLLCEVGDARDALEAEYPDLPFFWLSTENSEAEVFWIEAGGL